jgi:sacsin
MSTVLREEFGQEQPLTVALHKLIRDYPLSVGLFKEFIQNADDASATEIEFTLDRRTHPSRQLPSAKLARLCGPALIIRNNAPFTDIDLSNIQKLGHTQKAEAPAKIGRFGLGFNCSYNVTDYPELLTRDALFIFDPHKTGSDYASDSKPGGRWSISDQLWKVGGDILRPFAVAGLQEGALNTPDTAFRLPLRTADHVATNGKIRAETCAPESIRALMNEFEDFAPSILLFLKTVLKVSFYEIKPSARERTELIRIETINGSEVEAARRPLLSVLQGDFDTVLKTLSTVPDDQRTVSFTHALRVKTSSQTREFHWAVSAGFHRGEENRLLTLARRMWERREKALPWTGVAARLPKPDKTVGKPVAGEVFCFLPLPDARGSAKIPVHLHGFFDISSSRRTLTHEPGAEGTTESLRAEWNRTLTEDGLSTSYCELLKYVLRARPDIDADFFYKLFPEPNSSFPEPLTLLTPAFYALAAEAPFFKTIEGVWQTAEKIRSVPNAIRPPLLAEKFSLVPEPEIPGHIAAGLAAAERPLTDLSVADIKTLYKVTADPDCELGQSTKQSLRNPEWLQALLKFVLKEIGPEALQGLPFLLTADNKLHAFGLYANWVFLADKQQRRIFSSYRHHFLDEALQDAEAVKPHNKIKVSVMTAEKVVEWLKHVSAPQPAESSSRKWEPVSKALPNQKWLIEVSKYLVKQPKEWTPNRDELDQSCLIPDQFQFLHQGGAPCTPLIPIHSQSKRLVKALTSFRVGLVTGEEELLTAIESLCRRFPDTIVWELTPRDLLQALAGQPVPADQPLIAPEQCEVILEFLSSPEAVASYDQEAAPWLESLKSLRIFPCEDSTLTPLAGCKCFLPTSVTGPPVSLEVKLLKRGTWELLLKKLQVPELTLHSLVEKALVPGYGGLDEANQVKALLWLRDHLDQALTDAGPAQQPFLQFLQGANLIHSSDGQLHCGRAVYFPGEKLVKEVMGDRALFPAMRLYQTDQERWLTFFTRLGMSRSPRPQDLADHISFLTGSLEQGAKYEDTAERLIAVLQHVIDNWQNFESAEVLGSDRATITFRELIRSLEWCPPLRGGNSLRHLLVADEPPLRLYRLTELFPPALGHLVGGIHCLLPIRQRENIPDVLRVIAPEVTAARLDTVIAHFEKLLSRTQDTPVESKALKSPLKAIYTFFGGPVPNPVGADDDEESTNPLRLSLTPLPETPELLRVRDTFAQRPCIYVDREKQFRPAEQVFLDDVTYATPWWAHFHYKDARLDLGLRALGRKARPSFADLCALTVTIHSETAGALKEDQASAFLGILQRIEFNWEGDGAFPDLFVLDRALRLLPPADLLFDDAYWLPANLDRSDLPLAHAQISRQLATRLHMGTLSERLRQEPKELTGSTNNAFIQSCARLQTLVTSPEFRSGLARVIFKAAPNTPAVDLNWLGGFTLVPMSRILCEYMVHTKEGDLSLGETEDDTLWVEGGSGESVLNVAESGANVMDVRLAETIKRRLNLPGLEDIFLVKMLGCAAPKDIALLLDQLKLPRVDEPAKQKDTSAEQQEGSDFLDDSDQTGEPDATPEEKKDDQESQQEQTDSAEESSSQPPENEQDTKTEDTESEGDESQTDEPENDSEDEEDESDTERGAPPPGSGGGGTQESEPGWERFGPQHKSKHPPQRKPQNRVVTYVLNNDQVAELQKKHDPANDEIPANKRLGDDAVGWVLQYERQQGRQPSPQRHNNPGFDVLSRDDQNEPRYIEVKGIKGGWGLDGVPISVRQFEFAKDKGEEFWLYVVEYADDPQEVTIHMIQDPVNQITQFRFDSGWQQLAAPAPPFRPLLPEPGLRVRVHDQRSGSRNGKVKSVNKVGTQLMIQIAWDDGRDGALPFEPLKVEILPAAEPTQGSTTGL